MDKNIFWSDENTLLFKKVKWDERELSIARCLSFDISNDLLQISCDLRKTSKIALFEFLKNSFKEFVDNPAYQEERSLLYDTLKKAYERLQLAFYEKVLPKLPYHKMLYQHQKETLFFGHNKQHNLFALDPGTGKSLTSISLSVLYDIKKTIIVCPTIVKWNWYRDLSEKFGFSPDHFTIIDRIKNRNLRAFLEEKYIILNYEQVKKNMDYLCKEEVGHIILDECHNIKGHLTDRHKHCDELIKRFPKARVTLLSGTPIKNRVNDMFAYFKVCGHPLGVSYNAFFREYVMAVGARHGFKIIGAKNMDDLYRRSSNFMIRYRIEDCVDLPEKNINKMILKVDEYKKEYNRVIEEMIANKERLHIHGALATLNIITSKAKLNSVLVLIDQLLENDKKVIVFSGYHAPMNDICAVLKDKCVRIDGSVPSFERDKRIQMFMKNDDIKVFVGQVGAAGVGVNLTVSHNVIFMDLPFTPTEVDQGIARCYRIGQNQKVNVFFPIAEDSIDEYLYEMIMDKRKDINYLVDNKQGDQSFGSVQDELFYKIIDNYQNNNGYENQSRDVITTVNP